MYMFNFDRGIFVQLRQPTAVRGVVRRDLDLQLVQRNEAENGEKQRVHRFCEARVQNMTEHKT